MTIEQLRGHEGELVSINGRGDLAFEWELRKYIDAKRFAVFIKITKGGMAFLRDHQNSKITFSVPPKNVDLIV